MMFLHMTNSKVMMLHHNVAVGMSQSIYDHAPHDLSHSEVTVTELVVPHVTDSEDMMCQVDNKKVTVCHMVPVSLTVKLQCYATCRHGASIINSDVTMLCDIVPAS